MSIMYENDTTLHSLLKNTKFFTMLKLHTILVLNAVQSIAKACKEEEKFPPSAPSASTPKASRHTSSSVGTQP